MSLSGWAVRIGVVGVVAAGLGALSAFLWFAIAPLPSYVIQPDGRATLSSIEISTLFAIDAYFAAIGFLVGVVIGIVTWISLKKLGWPMPVVAAIAGLLAAVICLFVASWLGPGELEPRLAAAVPGAKVPVAFALHSLSAVAVWTFAALIVPMIGSAFAREERGK